MSTRRTCRSHGPDNTSTPDTGEHRSWPRLAYVCILGLLRPLWSCDCLRTFSRCLADTADTADTEAEGEEAEEAELVARLRAVFGRYGSSCYTKHEAYQG